MAQTTVTLKLSIAELEILKAALKFYLATVEITPDPALHIPGGERLAVIRTAKRIIKSTSS